MNLAVEGRPQKLPGPIVLFGSGETSTSGQKAFDVLFRRLTCSPKVSLLETPAGFEPNSDLVIRRVAEFIEHRLQNFNPQVEIIPARSRNTEKSPDNPEIVKPMLDADLVFMGPGSPSYAIRQLRGSLAWQVLIARHYLGATLALASAATIAVSRYALPVYEIFKVGEDLHWKEGLDLFGLYGMPLVFIPHWNNTDGGEDLDTSRCFMGRERFARLMDILPVGVSVLGIDEHTALIIDMELQECQVIGKGGVTILHMDHEAARSKNAVDPAEFGLQQVAERRKAHVHYYTSGTAFPLSVWFTIKNLEPGAGIPESVWKTALETEEMVHKQDPPPPEVLALASDREVARRNNDWSLADSIRDQIVALGWDIRDTPNGPDLKEKVST